MGKQLFSVDSNAKTIKGQTYGFLTGVMYLAPSDISGFQVCPLAKLAACEAPCLFKAGRGVFQKIQLQRIAKTQRFFNEREAFMADVVWSIKAIIRKAGRMNLTPLIRMNGTSDIRWETVPVVVDGVTYVNIFAAFPAVQFYDYTKIPNRKNIPSNYDLTYSYSGVKSFEKYADQAIASGMRIAAVFRSASDIPATFKGLECIGGDDSDIRHLEPQGVIVALYAKGPAKKDYSGFVIDTKKIIPIRLAA